MRFATSWIIVVFKFALVVISMIEERLQDELSLSEFWLYNVDTIFPLLVSCQRGHREVNHIVFKLCTRNYCRLV